MSYILPPNKEMLTPSLAFCVRARTGFAYDTPLQGAPCLTWTQGFRTWLMRLWENARGMYWRERESLAASCGNVYCNVYVCFIAIFFVCICLYYLFCILFVAIKSLQPLLRVSPTASPRQPRGSDAVLAEWRQASTIHAPTAPTDLSFAPDMLTISYRVAPNKVYQISTTLQRIGN